jgi:hypothetical protein
MKIKYIFFLMLVFVLSACRGKSSHRVQPQEDTKAKQMLQGIWINQDDQDVAFKVKGDTVYYPDSISQPVYFQILADTFVLHGAHEVKYPILRQTRNLFVFRNLEGETVHLTLSNDGDEASLFPTQRPVALNQRKLIKRDTVVIFNGERYRCYAQVNPTSYKVMKSTYNDDGVVVDNFYYDNIVNLHIYHGSRKLFSSDFRKQQFSSKVPSDFLNQAVLSDITLESVDASGIHYIASLVVPDSMSRFEVKITIDYKGRMTLGVE